MKTSQLQENSRSAELLRAIGKILDDTYLGLSGPGLVVKFGTNGARNFLNRKEHYLQQQVLKRLKQKKLIEMQKIANQYEISLTNIGMEEYIRLEITNANIHSDSAVCMVIFDIPESEAKFRKKIRRILTEAAFIPLQKSVWISNIDAAESLTKLFEMQDRKKWIRVFTAYQH